MLDQAATAWSSRSRMPATTWTRRPCCCANPTARRRKSTKRSSACAPCCALLVPRASRCPRLKRSAYVSGRDARTPFPPPVAPPGVLLHGRHYSAQASRRNAEGHSGDGAQVRTGCPNVFHAGDGNLHPLILFDDSDPDSVGARRSLWRRDPGAKACRWAARSPASMASASRSSTRCVRSSIVRRWMRSSPSRVHSIRQACSIPARSIPTLHRCAEYGRMRVRAGDLRFAGAAAVLMDDSARQQC